MIIVEDDTLLKDSLSLFFRSKGCEVSAFETAEDALETMGKDRYGIVIADHWLRGMDGLTLLAQIAEIAPDAIRILITGQPNNEMIEKAKRTAVDGFILKPFTPDEIEAMIRRLIDRPEEEAVDAK